MIKSTLQSLLFISILSVIISLSGCHKSTDPAPTIAQAQLAKLSKTWKVTSVTLDDASQTGYENFILMFSGASSASIYEYTTTGRPLLSPWQANGKWNFVSGSETTEIIRDKGTVDELPITYAVTETTLQLTFQFSGTGYAGRINSASGKWVMTFGL
jgi:hypothetical protein